MSAIPLLERTLDVDGHEFAPPHLWGGIFGPVAEFFTRYPRIADCYCYSMDYPHLEGGARINRKAHEMLAPLGDAVLERYFAENGKWLLPTLH